MSAGGTLIGAGAGALADKLVTAGSLGGGLMETGARGTVSGALSGAGQEALDVVAGDGRFDLGDVATSAAIGGGSAIATDAAKGMLGIGAPEEGDSLQQFEEAQGPMGAQQGMEGMGTITEDMPLYSLDQGGIAGRNVRSIGMSPLGLMVTTGTGPDTAKWDVATSENVEELVGTDRLNEAREYGTFFPNIDQLGGPFAQGQTPAYSPEPIKAPFEQEEAISPEENLARTATGINIPGISDPIQTSLGAPAPTVPEVSTDLEPDWGAGAGAMIGAFGPIIADAISDEPRRETQTSRQSTFVGSPASSLDPESELQKMGIKSIELNPALLAQGIESIDEEEDRKRKKMWMKNPIVAGLETNDFGGPGSIM
jgi:hypothetical protein